jgi:hypothetical protein
MTDRDGNLPNGDGTVAGGGVFAPDLMETHISIGLRRLPRRPCERCGKRRVLFTLTVLGFTHGQAMCAVCAGVR